MGHCGAGPMWVIVGQGPWGSLWGRALSMDGASLGRHFGVWGEVGGARACCSGSEWRQPRALDSLPVTKIGLRPLLLNCCRFQFVCRHLSSLPGYIVSVWLTSQRH